jgi:hypothetical protein
MLLGLSSVLAAVAYHAAAFSFDRAKGDTDG